MKAKIFKVITLVIITLSLLSCGRNEKKTIKMVNSVDITVEESKTYLEKDQYLPIGTIVSVAGIEGKIMIIDRVIIYERDNYEVAYDYFGAHYPQGTITVDNQVVFDKRHIEVIHQLGYVNEEFLEVADLLLESLGMKNESGFQDLLSKDISQDLVDEFYDNGIVFPIGTVFEVDGESAIILGYNMKFAGWHKTFDYLIVRYPYGIVKAENRAIDHKDIPRDSIRFLGYIDDSFFEMITGEKK